MAIKREFHSIKGMQRDLTRSKFSPEFAFDAQNIRLTAREDNTLLSVTNEKGTKECELKDKSGNIVTIIGQYIGHCILNNYVILFTSSEDKDYIYRLENKQDYFEVVRLYSGYLNFDFQYPIEAFSLYETNEIQKVYWTDNLNPIRYINITKTYQENYDFNLVKPINTTNINVLKTFESGNFSAGTIQYVMTYYSLYGSETNIFAISDLNYCSFKDRGASPEEKVTCAFNIKLPISYSINNEYDYIRIYSIHRTSLDSVPTVKVIADVSTQNIPKDETDYLLYIDTGSTGYTIDPVMLQYIGGENLIAKTLTVKDNTLFAGNITLTKNVVPLEIREDLKKCTISFKLDDQSIIISNNNSFYPNINQLDKDSRSIKGFKARECYRFGVQFQGKTGEWSEVIFIGDYECNISPNIENSEDTTICQIPKAVLQIPKTLITKLNNYYIGVRGVCVYPNFNDRNIVCQGVVCPTVFNLQDRDTNSPYAQSSWFTRPIPYDGSWQLEYKTSGASNVDVADPQHDAKDGEVLAFKHFESIYGHKSNYRLSSQNPIIRKDYSITRGEIQCSQEASFESLGSSQQDQSYISSKRSSFGVDCGIVTMYSPDIEFDDSVGYLKDADLNFRIVGAVLMANTLSDVSITTTSNGYYPDDIGFFGNWIDNNTVQYAINNENKSGRGMATAGFWSALPKLKEKTIQDKVKREELWAVYPWHRSGSLIASGVPENDEKRLWELKRKVMSNLWISSHSVYLDSPYKVYRGISPVNTWHSGDGLIKIKAINNPNKSHYIYYGDVDKVITFNAQDYLQDTPDGNAYGYPIYGTPVTQLGIAYFRYFNQHAIPMNDKSFYTSNKDVFTVDDVLKAKDAVGVEPISMKYKSGPHAVFAINYLVQTLNNGDTIPTQIILPNNGYNTNNSIAATHSMIWDKSPTSWIQDSLSFHNPNAQAFLWLGELYRTNINNRFGGNTDEAILNNTWEIASQTMSLEIENSDYLTIVYSGDTYVQRYDALRTYEYTSEDTNSIVDILSFICETKINLDGRYDRNRGNISNITATPLNFNLFNQVYNQKNNYFNYHTLDYNRFSNNYFPNTVVWSKSKTNAEEIDTWTNLNMASSLDLDGDKGEIESLNIFNNEIYCFQKRALSNILFNSRVQIPTSDNIPIEITNGLKVNGKRYISNTIGCSNKWSITESPLGIYFIDNETNSIYLFNGKIQSLSDSLGFRQWVGENNSYEQWNPIDYKNFRTYYDKNNDDVYFINDKTCLCYSELLNQFTSFLSYEHTPAMFNIESEFYSFNKNKIWHNFAGEYNMFYGEYKPYSITVVSNADEPYDKIFNTVEFRADSWDKNILINNATFDTLEVWNEYQHGKSILATVLNQPSALKKKFRIWRANIPRDDSNHRDRIRNTWAYIKLSMNTPNMWKTQFYDMNVYYFV